MRLEDLVGAIRAADDDDPDLVAATQARVRRSLETRARGRHQVVGILTTLAILFVGTVSWALATGHVAALWAPPRVVPSPPAPHAAAPHITAPRTTGQRPAQDIAVAPAPVLVPEIVAPLPAPVAARRVAAPPEPPVEALYRTAHDLHFHGGEPAVSLAAWDAYLAAEPTGRFAVEARYNRAIVLARLGRYAEARAALEPFARGEVEPVGYRQAEAAQLVARLAHSR